MKFADLVKTRQSDRAYKNTPVEYEKLTYILECARMAPSACNAQPWHFLVVDKPALCAKLAKAASSQLLQMNHFAAQAPVFIALVEESPNFTSKAGGWIKKKHFPLIDIGIVASHICLAAADVGLGSCMLGWFDEQAVKQVLNIPDKKRVPLLITLGYSASRQREKIRKPINKIHSQNQYPTL